MENKKNNKNSTTVIRWKLLRLTADVRKQRQRTATSILVNQDWFEEQKSKKWKWKEPKELAGRINWTSIILGMQK